VIYRCITLWQQPYLKRESIPVGGASDQEGAILLLVLAWGPEAHNQKKNEELNSHPNPKLGSRAPVDEPGQSQESTTRKCTAILQLMHCQMGSQRKASCKCSRLGCI